MTASTRRTQSLPGLRPRLPRTFILLAAALATLGSSATSSAQIAGSPGNGKHGIAMHGEPELQRDRPPRYVNPAAPKGGRITHGVVGTFDSLNPFIVKGLAPTQIRGYVIESLMARGYDEPFTLYGLLAISVETDANRSTSPSSSIRRRDSPMASR